MRRSTLPPLAIATAAVLTSCSFGSERSSDRSTPADSGPTTAAAESATTEVDPARLGGPPGLEAALRAWGDDTTSVDRWEPELSEWAPGETRDTSTPRAMAQNLEALTLATVLPEEDRDVLLSAPRDNTTGNELIRAGVPDGWVVGDKTGTATHGGRNDIAIVEPPGGAPIVLAIYSNRLDPEADPEPALIAEATEVILDRLSA